MVHEAMDAGVDPFAPRRGRVATIARRLGVTEGQLYSMVIGVLVAWAVSANALPSVVWDGSSSAGAPVGPVASLPGPLETAAPVTVPSTEPLAPPAAAVPPFPGLDGFATAAPNDAQPSPAMFPVEPSGPPEAGEDHGPVRVTGGGYASASAGTPMATLGVPDGSVAVSRRAGSTENVAYLRLAGRGGSLELVVDSNGANIAEPVAGLKLCVVTAADWAVGHGDVGLDKAPAVDCDGAISGVRAEDGTRWSFAVGGLDVQQVSGVAVLPDENALAPEFQVVFRID